MYPSKHHNPGGMVKETPSVPRILETRYYPGLLGSGNVSGTISRDWNRENENLGFAEGNM